ncbi:MAG: acetyl-CoA hydrolase/transferase family protein, partial [Pseudomonadota bacterium]
GEGVLEPGRDARLERRQGGMRACGVPGHGAILTMGRAGRGDYNRRFVSNVTDDRMSQIAELLRPGQRIFVAGSVNEPGAVLAALRDATLPGNLRFIQFPIAGYNREDFTAYAPDARFTTFFMTPHLKDADPARLDFLPMQMRRVYDYVANNVDVVLLQVARGADGRLRLGPNVDFLGAALDSAATVIAEQNTAFTAPAGCPVIDEARIDALIEAHRPLHEMAAPAPDPAAEAIGALVAGEVRDGDCIQTGIGGIPAAILARLTDKNDLGLHGGLIDDGGMALIENGNVTGARKEIDRGVHVTGMALGSHAMMDWLAERPEVAFHGANYTHEVSVIGRLSGFVSVNSAVEVDLYGQVNAEMAGGRQISGTGGSVDFMRAARASAGGRSIIAMNATARGGSVSRIVPKVELVTALRTDVDLVVTEYGVARLRDAPLRSRAEALIEIAAPAFRDELRAAIP